MSATSPQPAPSRHPEPEEAVPLDEGAVAGLAFDQDQWNAARSGDELATPAGRKVLAWALLLLAIAWTAYIAWSAGRAIAGEPLSSPMVAQWAAIAAGPLALLGLAWLMFGRTRRREAERFTRSVVTMRSEVQSLEALLEVLSKRIGDSRSELTMITQHLMQLGDEATGKLGGITREFDSSSEKLIRHGEALDRAAESARTDIAVLLDDLPRAEEHSRAISAELRDAESETARRAEEFDRQLAALAERSREADSAISEATSRLVASLSEVETAGSAAAERVGFAREELGAAADALLEKTASTLDEIRSGIDVQAGAVSALVEQAAAGIGRAGAESAEALASNVDLANRAMETLSAHVAEQERASQAMAAEIDRALGELGQRFAEIADQGDERSARFLEALARSRSELETLASGAADQDRSIAGLAERTETLRDGLDQLAQVVREEIGTALQSASEQGERLTEAAKAMRPEFEWMRDAATEASDRLDSAGSAIAAQQDQLTALLASLDEGVGDAEGRLIALSTAISGARAEAEELSRQTGPALVEAMVQVREAAAQAAHRAREAIAGVIPETAEELSSATREALERVIRDSIEERLAGVETVAERAVEAARGAAERLTGQMLLLGQSASALEEHIEKQNELKREADSEAFARRVALLIDSMNSAAIDVGKILSNELDDRAWESYLKGDRGVFTKRAARLITSSEARAIRAHYEAESEFQQAVNRYIHDFESMLRRVLAEREGGAIAVTLMSSDMGKLYAALAEAIEHKR